MSKNNTKQKINRLPDNYKECFCGAKLNKRNRFAIKLEAPKHINTKKRLDTGIKYKEKTIVRYCCEECYNNIHNSVYTLTHGGGNWFIYYKDSYPC